MSSCLSVFVEVESKPSTYAFILHALATHNLNIALDATKMTIQSTYPTEQSCHQRRSLN